MRCPVDKEPLVILEYQGVEIDYCLTCGGVWLDAGELELLLGDEAACASFIAGGDPKAIAGEKPRRCPACRKKMAKIVTKGDKPVVYDQCKRGHGLWFDDGELENVLQQGMAVQGSTQVVTFLRDMFPSKAGSDTSTS